MYIYIYIYICVCVCVCVCVCTILKCNLSKLFHTFVRATLISLSVDEILQPRYVNILTDFRHLLP